MKETILQARLALGRRDRELAEKHAEQLRELGFKIVQIASRGVSFEGPIELFEQTFDSPVIDTEHGTTFEKAPSIPKVINEYVDSVYFPTRPTFFHRLN